MEILAERGRQSSVYACVLETKFHGSAGLSTRKKDTNSDNVSW